MPVTDIRVYRDLMGENDKWAADTRHVLKKHNVAMLNIIGSPGCGKTTLLECMVRTLKNTSFAVLEGDVETTRDAERLDRLGIPTSQLLTGGACHLEAKLVNHALKDLSLDDLDIVIVENVGNMVCPAEFDIGENAKAAVLSVTEGEDKPLKYPLLFQEAGVTVVTKTDLLPHLDFDVEQCVEFIGRVNSGCKVFQVSAKSGQGMDDWTGWMEGFVRENR